MKTQLLAPLTGLFMLISFQSISQKIYDSFNVGFLIGSNLESGEEAKLELNLGHEWKPFPFFGIEAETTVGHLFYNSQNEEYNPENRHNYSAYNYKDIGFTYETISTKLNGYLILLYDDQDRPEAFLFASLTMGVAAIQTKGKLTTHESEILKSSSHYSPHVYTGFNVGLSGAFSDKFLIELALGGSTIKFNKALKKLNDGLNKPFPFKFMTSVLDPVIRVSFTYKLNYGKGR